MNMKISPRLSIGLPVYNGEKFIKESIDSLINQTFQNFEIIISDNSSTDATEQICKDYVTHDKRIKYYRQFENKGAPANFLKVLGLANGHFFMWAAADDKFENNHLENLIQALESDNKASVAMSSAKIIDDTGCITSQVNLPQIQNSVFQKELSYALALGSKHHYFIYGMWVRTVLNNLLPIPNGRYSDRVFILFASTRIKFILIDEPTYIRRINNIVNWKRYKKTDPKLASLYRSNIASFKSIYHLYNKLKSKPSLNESIFTRFKIIYLYSFWIMYGTIYSLKIMNPVRKFLKSLGLRSPLK